MACIVHEPSLNKKWEQENTIYVLLLFVYVSPLELILLCKYCKVSVLVTAILKLISSNGLKKVQKKCPKNLPNNFHKTLTKLKKITQRETA